MKIPLAGFGWGIFILFLVSPFFTQCKKNSDYAPVYFQEDFPEETDGAILNFSAEEFQGKEKSWDLVAKRAYLLRDNSGTMVKDFTLNYYQQGKKSNVVMGITGHLDNAKKTLTVTGDVTVESANGRKIFARDVLYSEATGKISSDLPVKIMLETGDIILARSFEADHNLDKIVLKSGTGYHPSQK